MVHGALISEAPPAVARALTVREVIRAQLVRAVFQPIVDLRSRQVVGYEALARGPEGTALETPGALFSAAEREGLAVELDWACRQAALRAALVARVHPTRAIFVNIEPRTLAEPAPRALEPLLERARAELTVVAEITERAVTDAPASLLVQATRLHRNGWILALDDLGVDPRSLALLPFIAPDVMKLDMSIVQTRDLSLSADVVSAVQAHAERVGGHILAEGVETQEHLDTALALGADLGQGWLFGRPEALPGDAARPAHRPITQSQRAEQRSVLTPFELLSAHREPRRGNKDLLLRMSLATEAQVAGEGQSAVIISTFQDAKFFTATSRRRYRRMARHGAFVGALGVGLSETPEPGVRGASLSLTEPLRGEWDVCAVGPYLAGAFAARDLGDDGPDGRRRFDFVMTRDRDLVIAATRELMTRVSPLA